MINPEELFCKLTASKAARDKPSLLSKLVWDELVRGCPAARALLPLGSLELSLQERLRGRGFLFSLSTLALGDWGRATGLTWVIKLQQSICYQVAGVPALDLPPLWGQVPAKGTRKDVLSGLDSPAVARAWDPCYNKSGHDTQAPGCGWCDWSPEGSQ